MAYKATPLSALAEPTRAAIIDHLSTAPMAVGELAERLPVSRPAVSQHLKVLKDAGLVQDRVDGTRRVYRLDPSGLASVRAWLDRTWDSALASYAAAAGKDQVK